MKKQQPRLRQYAGQVAGYELEISRLKAQMDKLRRMLFGQSSEKSRNKLENKILQAEKRLAELESRLEAAINCLNVNEPVPAVPDAVTAPKTTPEKTARPPPENRCQPTCRGKHRPPCRRTASARPVVAN